MAAVTRLGLYGGPRGLYGDFSGKSVNNNLVATAVLVFGSLATLNATGTLTATAPLVFGSTATLVAPVGELSATAALVFGSSATLDDANAGTVDNARLIVPPHPGLAIVDEGHMELHFQTWTQQLTELEIVGGSGSPEGTVSAKQKTLYMDVSGATGSVLYIKRLPDIDGDDTMGWRLI